jgi:hypothetical protein
MGFVVPGGTFSNFDPDLRVQLMTSYVNAGSGQTNGVNSGSDVRFGETNNVCSAALDCLGSLLSGTSYRTWQTELKAASDLAFNNVTVAPFVTIFAKNAQSLSPIAEGVAGTGWTDMGGTIGVDTTVDVSNHMLFGMRGSVGTAYRSTSFSSVQGGALYVDQQSAMATNSSSNPFLAIAEANLIWKPERWQTIKAYAGVQFDSRTPLAPNQFADAAGGSLGPITYEIARNYYFGASLKMDFDGLRGLHF